MTRTALILLLLAGTLAAQNRGGRYSAIDYAFGQGQPDRPLRIDGGPYTAGSNVVITIDLCDVPALDGNSFCPLATNDPVQIGSVAAGNLETETPSAVSCPTPTQVATCTITVNLTYNHTSADTIRSSTYGLQEAANYASLNGGGVAVTSPQWTSAGGTQAMINAVSLASTVYIEDLRGSVPQYWWPSGAHTTPMIIVSTTAGLPSGAPSGTMAFVVAAGPGQQVWLSNNGNWTQQGAPLTPTLGGLICNSLYAAAHVACVNAPTLP